MTTTPKYIFTDTSTEYTVIVHAPTSAAAWAKYIKYRKALLRLDLGEEANKELYGTNKQIQEALENDVMVTGPEVHEIE